MRWLKEEGSGWGVGGFITFFQPWGPFLESPDYFSGPQTCLMLVLFAFKNFSFNNFEKDTMKLSVNEAKFAGLWARNCATIQQVLILKFAFKVWTRKGTGPFGKRAPGNEVLSFSSVRLWDLQELVKQMWLCKSFPIFIITSPSKERCLLLTLIR